MDHSIRRIILMYLVCAFMTLICTSQSASFGEEGTKSPGGSEIPNEKLANFLAKCDRKKFLYFEPKKTCYHVYNRGPCKAGEYLMYSERENSAKCEVNPCVDDGKVHFNDTCYELNKRGPCDPWDAVVINKKTLQFECGEIDLSEIPLFSRDEPCPKGYYRSYIICRKLRK